MRRTDFFDFPTHLLLQLVNFKEIGAAYGVEESAVTQASRCVVMEMEGGESFRKAVGLLVEKYEV